MSRGIYCWCGEPARYRCENGGYGGECPNLVCGEHGYCNECYPVPEGWPEVCVACNGPLIYDVFDPTIGLRIKRQHPLCADCGLEQPGPT